MVCPFTIKGVSFTSSLQDIERNNKKRIEKYFIKLHIITLISNAQR
jgi:hypothetical protein